MGVYEWTISGFSPNDAYNITESGPVNGVGVSSYNHAIRPVFYLNSDVVLSGGTGSVSDPYRIA